jgi:hypothetical protein
LHTIIRKTTDSTEKIPDIILGYQHANYGWLGIYGNELDKISI